MSKKKLIIDLAIGDGYVNKPKSQSALSGLTIKHSQKQVGYLLYKKNLLESAGFTCSLDSYTDTHGHHVIQLRTNRSPLIREVRNELYPFGKKVLTEDILAHFDEKSLAILFQDDGGREHTKYHRHSGQKYEVLPYINAFVLHTSSFTLEENALLVGKLEQMGIESRMKERKGYPVILITKVQAKERFVELVYPHLHPDMKYKIDAPVKYHGRK